MLLALVMTLALGVCGCGGGGDGDKDVVNLTGRWIATYTYTDGDVETWTFDITQTGNSLTGTAFEQGNTGNSVSITGTVTGNHVEIIEHWSDVIYKDVGDISGNQITGTGAYADGVNPATWTATRSN